MTHHYPEDDAVVDEYGEVWDEDYTNEGSDEPVEEVDDDPDDFYLSKEPEDHFNEPIQWAKIKLGTTVLNVCSTGIVRREGDLFYHVTSGVTLVGTTYRYIVVQTDDGVFEKFLMHELVWKAFNGDVPNHWEVRHKSWIPQEYNREYPNDLHCLEIYPKVTAPFEGW